MVLQQQLFITVELKIGTLYPRMSNKSALSMVSNLLQDNTLDLNCNQHAHSYFCLGVHVPPGVSIWGYMFIFEGTHILELFFHSKRIEAMKSDHLDVYNSDIIML